MLSVAEARERICAAFSVLPAEQVALPHPCNLIYEARTFFEPVMRAYVI